MAERWSPDHLRLHQLLLRQPELLPRGSTLLLAVSGGQDSMALVGLLRDLQRLHHWSLQLWHGDHRWRADSDRQASELAAWARSEGLSLQIERWETPQSSEAAARAWRYQGLTRCAERLAARHVLTGHTASDRAETLLLHLARGSHRRGLASLRLQRPLTDQIELVRPLLLFDRNDTARIRQQLALPLWLDPSNDDRRFSRNRIRAEVLPVLEALHPGAGRRISQLSQRLAEEQSSQDELLTLVLQSLSRSDPAEAQQRLDRDGLMALQPANRRLLLHTWLKQQGCSGLQAEVLESLQQRLEPLRGNGCHPLSGGQRLCWDRRHLWLEA